MNPGNRLRRGSRGVALATVTAITLLASLLTGGPPAGAQEARQRAPEIGGDEDWIGTTRPAELADFKGKVLLLDFWTFG